MKEFEKKFVEKCDKLLIQTSERIKENEEMLSLITDIIIMSDEALKNFSKQKKKRMNALKYEYILQKKLCSFSAYLNFFIMDILTSLKYLCITEHTQEKKYFIKQSFASIFEFITRITCKESQKIKTEIGKNNMELVDKYDLMISELVNFAQTHSFKRMEDIRNKISNHYDEDALLYIKHTNELDEISALVEIQNVFLLIENCSKFNDSVMPILAVKIENNNKILAQINA